MVTFVSQTLASGQPAAEIYLPPFMSANSCFPFAFSTSLRDWELCHLFVLLPELSCTAAYFAWTEGSTHSPASQFPAFGHLCACHAPDASTGLSQSPCLVWDAEKSDIPHIKTHTVVSSHRENHWASPPICLIYTPLFPSQYGTPFQLSDSALPFVNSDAATSPKRFEKLVA